MRTKFKPLTMVMVAEHWKRPYIWGWLFYLMKCLTALSKGNPKYTRFLGNSVEVKKGQTLNQALPYPQRFHVGLLAVYMQCVSTGLDVNTPLPAYRHRLQTRALRNGQENTIWKQTVFSCVFISIQGCDKDNTKGQEIIEQPINRKSLIEKSWNPKK